MIECKVCNRQFKMLTNTHLTKIHGLSPEQYLEKFPGATLCDEEMAKKYVETRHRVARMQCGRPGCTKLIETVNKAYCSYACSFKHRMSGDATGRGEQNGEKNPNFKNGWYSLLRKNRILALNRDRHTCQCCGRKEDKTAQPRVSMDVHHRRPHRFFVDKVKAHDLSNLVTLCDSCHRTVETETRFRMDQMVDWLDEIMAEQPHYVMFGDFCEQLIPALKARVQNNPHFINSQPMENQDIIADSHPEEVLD